VILIVTGFKPVREIKYNDGSCVYIPDRVLKNYNVKVVRSGSILEVYQYQEKVYYNYEGFERIDAEKTKPIDWQGKNEKNLSRARQNIRRLIWCNRNEYSKFLTLTYKDNMQDLNKFYADWHVFIQGMKRKGYMLKYLYVLEYQERGAIHAHVIIFNNEYIPWRVVKECWERFEERGEKINSIKDVNNLGAYVCKYLTKNTIAEYNSKSYHTSRGLKRPIERKITAEESEVLIEQLFRGNKVIYQTEYDVVISDEITNKVQYSQLLIGD